MAEELKELIEKIHKEGVKAAEEKARAIEDEAKAKADEILRKAERQAEKLIAEAKEKIAKMEESGKTSLKQAGRDLLLALRREINGMLDKIVVSHVHKALAPEELTRLIGMLVREYGGKEKVIISLKKEDMEKLEKGFLGELRDEMKKGIVLKPSEAIRGGFTISYDEGKSYFDFTDKSLAEYISLSLKTKMGELLKEIMP